MNWFEVVWIPVKKAKTINNHRFRSWWFIQMHKFQLIQPQIAFSIQSLKHWAHSYSSNYQRRLLVVYAQQPVVALEFWLSPLFLDWCQSTRCQWQVSHVAVPRESLWISCSPRFWSGRLSCCSRWTRRTILLYWSVNDSRFPHNINLPESVCENVRLIATRINT